MKRFLLIVTALFAISGGVFGLEVKEGRIKLVLDEQSGKFSAFYEKSAGSGEYIPLLFSRDPRTSGFGFLVGNRIYSMGESSGFSLESGREGTGAYFLWESKVFRVKQRFSFIRSEGSTLADGFSISIEVENRSSRDQAIGVHYLFDTYLGEEDDRHFITDSGIALKNETEYESLMPAYWLSPSTEEGFQGLQGMLRSRGVSQPDRIIFANWKRLQENTWNFTVQSSRNFNLLPYSINDSAVCYYYLPKKVASGEKRELKFAFGAYRGGRYSIGGEEESSEIQELYNQAASGSQAAPDDLESQIREDLQAANDLLGKLDELLAYPEDLSNEDIQVLRQILTSLEQRKERYSR